VTEGGVISSTKESDEGSVEIFQEVDTEGESERVGEDLEVFKMTTGGDCKSSECEDAHHRDACEEKTSAANIVHIETA
jgi:hypothetical protein